MVGRLRALHVPADVRGEVAASACVHRGWKGIFIERAHMASLSDCFSNATVSTRSWRPAAMRSWATMADPPTEPAVCTRNMGLPTAPSAGEVQLGHHHALEEVRALPMTTASMSAHDIWASSRRWAASRTSPAIDTSPRTAVCASGRRRRWQLVPCPSLTLQDAHEVLLQAHTRGGVADGPVGLAGRDAGGGLAEADEAGGHDRVGGEALPTG